MIQMCETAIRAHKSDGVMVAMLQALAPNPTRTAQSSLKGLLGGWLDALKSFFGVRARPPPLEEMTDEELVHQFRRHTEKRAALFEVLVRRHQQWLLRLLLYTLGNPGDADDVGQEVFIRAFMALEQFKGKSSFRTWLRKIAMNTAFNWQRHRSTSERYTQAAGALEVLLTHNAAPGVDALEHREILLEVLHKLPYIYCEVLILRHVEEMELKDIASALDIGLSATKMRLKRAREEFKTLYQGMEES